LGDGSDVSNRTIAMKIISSIPSTYAVGIKNRFMINLLFPPGGTRPDFRNNNFAKRVPNAGRNLSGFSVGLFNMLLEIRMFCQMREQFHALRVKAEIFPPMYYHVDEEVF
jgi:hypothetical protein